MLIYDTLSGQKQELKTQNKKLRIFVCGPTVYDYSHIGHARTYLAFDMFVKYLRQKQGYNVFYLQNITDIDDKIIKRADENNEDAKDLAKRFEKEYYADMEALNIESVNEYARATDHIKEIISQVERLLKKDFAYVIEDDGIYYDISEFKDYGKLSGRTALQAEDATSRIDESIAKKNRGDFALWKFSKPGEPEWPSPWGSGRPGWHIEDTAITEKFLGAQYDLHGGARDLIFPHHEAEIAQMEAISGKEPLVEYWMHSGFLTIGGEKMSKSLGNFITIREALEESSAETLRLFFTTKHYRSPIDYTKEGIKEAEANKKRLTEFWISVKEKKASEGEKNDEAIKKYQDNFWNLLEDDFNTPQSFAELFQLVSYVYKKESLSKKDKEIILDLLKDINSIFGIIDEGKIPQTVAHSINLSMAYEVAPKDVADLVKKREKAREDKNWEEADRLRDEIKKLGYEIRDTDSGTKIRKL